MAKSKSPTTPAPDEYPNDTGIIARQKAMIRAISSTRSLLRICGPALQTYFAGLPETERRICSEQLEEVQFWVKTAGDAISGD
jgi:hypothetical protein